MGAAAMIMEENLIISVILFSSANPDNVKRNIDYISELADMQLVEEVREIIGDQKRVSWANS